jgi:hypothetical protein
MPIPNHLPATLLIIAIAALVLLFPRFPKPLRGDPPTIHPSRIHAKHAGIKAGMAASGKVFNLIPTATETLQQDYRKIAYESYMLAYIVNYRAALNAEELRIWHAPKSRKAGKKCAECKKRCASDRYAGPCFALSCLEVGGCTPTDAPHPDGF